MEEERKGGRKRAGGGKNSGRYKIQAVHQQEHKQTLDCLLDATPFDDLTHHDSGHLKKACGLPL